MSSSIFLLPEIQVHILRYCSMQDMRNLALTNGQHSDSLQWLLYRTLEIPSTVLEWKDSVVASMMKEYTKHLHVCRKTAISAAAAVEISKALNLFELSLHGNPGLYDAEFSLLAGGTLRGLKILDVASTHVSDLFGLEKLVTLEELYLSATRVTDDGLFRVSMLQHLQKLDLRDNSGFKTKGVEHLVALKDLRYLGVSGCWGLDAEAFDYIGRMRKLEVLLAYRCGLTDDAVAYLKGLKSLWKLDVGGNFLVSDAGVIHLVGMERLRELCLSSCPDVTVRSVPVFQQMKSLEKLNLKFNESVNVSGLSPIRVLLNDLEDSDDD